MSLTNQTVVVIGGSAGIGRAVAAAAHRLGARVAILARSEGHLKDVAEALPEAESHLVDVRDVRSLDYCLEELSSIDHLVFSAADLSAYPFLETDLGEAKRMFDVKFWGSFAAAQSAARFMPESGSITFFSGIAARMPVRGLAVVAAINSAIEGLTRALALELSPIRVNAISPGFVDTGEADEGRLRHLIDTLPAKRAGTPEDIAEGVMFLIRNAYTTGTVLRMDGGRAIV